MTTLTLTPNVALGTVTLTIAAAPSGAVTLTRTDANGVGPVRLRVGDAPIAGALVVIDHEAALTGLVRYDVLDAAAATISASTTLADPAGPAVLVRSVQLPSIAAAPLALAGYTGDREPAAVTLDPIDRPDPLPVFGATPLRSGRLTFRTASYADALALDRAASTGQALTLRQREHAGLDMFWYASGQGSISPLARTSSGWAWAYDVEYREVSPSALPLLGAAGWSYADVIAAHPDFSAVRAAYADFASLTAGTPT